jgi:hypothetical protein
MRKDRWERPGHLTMLAGLGEASGGSGLPPSYAAPDLDNPSTPRARAYRRAWLIGYRRGRLAAGRSWPPTAAEVEAWDLAWHFLKRSHSKDL